MAEKLIDIACLGRPFRLGMLYDCRTDTLIHGFTLWDSEALAEHLNITPNESSEFSIIAGDSFENKALALGLSAEVKLSLLGGLIDVGGSAKYAYNHKTSVKQTRLTLQYKCTTKSKSLSMNHLAQSGIKHNDAFDNNIATHVVTGIDYGAEAFFVFDSESSSTEDSHKFEGELKGTLSLVIGKITASASASISTNDTNTFNNFKCTFHGDFILDRNPTTFSEALEAYKKMSQLLGPNKEKDSPKKAQLFPLTALDSKGAKLVRNINSGLIDESVKLLEILSVQELRLNDVINMNICQKFSIFRKKVNRCKALLSNYQRSFKQKLVEIVPKIRGGSVEEIELHKLIKAHYTSMFREKIMESWCNNKELEAKFLQARFNDIKDFKIFQTLGELQAFTFDLPENSQVVCLKIQFDTETDNVFFLKLEEYIASVDAGSMSVRETMQEQENLVHSFNVDTEASRQKLKEFQEMASFDKNFNEAFKDFTTFKDKITSGLENFHFVIVHCEQNQPDSTIAIEMSMFSTFDKPLELPPLSSFREAITKTDVKIPFDIDLPWMLCNGHYILIKGVTLPGDKGHFAIELNDEDDNVALQVGHQFSNQTIDLGTYLSGEWIITTVDYPNPIEIGQAVEILIIPREEHYNVAVNCHFLDNYEHKIPLDIVRKLHIEGNLKVDLVQFK